MKQKESKLKKWQKALIGISIPIGAIVLAFIAFVIVMMTKSYHSDIKTDYKEHTTSISKKTLDFAHGEDEFVEGKIESTPIVLSDKHLSEFEDYLSSVKPEYEFSELYNIDTALKRYNKNNITKVEKHKHDVRVNGKFNAGYLYELVLKNNEAFLKEKQAVKNMYEVPNNSEIKELCEWICRVLAEYANLYPDIDLNTVSCNLYDLKILSPISSFDNAFINEENVFNYDKKQMDMNEFAMHTDDIYTTTFYHEMVHLCQICCDCYSVSDDEWRVGIGKSYGKDTVNTFSWYWLNEAAAEKIMSSTLDVEYSTYRMRLGYLDSFDYIAEIDSSVASNMVERITFTHDIQSIYDTFDIKTEAEKLEFIKLMYSVEVLQMSPNAFYDAYKEKYGIDLKSSDDIEADFRLKLKDDILLSMTKLFYRNLARQIYSGNTTVQDMYYLIKIWENKLCYHCNNNEYGHMAFFKDFYNDYLKIQNVFFEKLSNDNSISVDDLENSLQNYSINIREGNKQKAPNCDLKFFNNEEKSAISYYITLYYWTGRPCIRECVDIAKQCEEKIKTYNAQ